MADAGNKRLADLFSGAVAGAGTLDDVLEGVVSVLNGINAEGDGRIGYVSGILTSDTPELVEVNARRLEGYTDYLRRDAKFPVFSSTDIFSGELADRFGGLGEAEWHRFWRRVLEDGRVTDIFMTPRWRGSAGAKDEHETAKRIGLTIHYVEDHPELKSIMDSHKK